MAVIKDKKCMIIGAAPLASGAVFEEFDPKEHYVICADAGYDTAVQYGVRPDLVIGDFDSAAKRPPETIRTIKLPVEKDVTDMMGAVMVGQKLGYKTFVLIGGLGGDRFDHSMANLDVLFLVASTTQPTPSTLVLDKLSAIAVDKGVQPVIVCTKSDLAEAEFLRSAYEKSTLPFIRIDLSLIHI